MSDASLESLRKSTSTGSHSSCDCGLGINPRGVKDSENHDMVQIQTLSPIPSITRTQIEEVTIVHRTWVRMEAGPAPELVPGL